MGPNGELDSSFGDSGVALLPHEAADSSSTLLAFDRDGVIVAAGHVPVLYRYTSSGRLDPTFGTGGSCNLAEVGLGTPIAIFNADHDRLVLVSNRADGTHAIARIWL
jgi:hypothetical protein